MSDALHPRVDLYRLVRSGGAAPALNIPGPLRILVAIGSPEAQNARGELLDMEAELARILDATEDARRKGEAALRILETGSVKAIRAALEQERWHVLYISCHARPGELILEDEEGDEDAVSAERLWREALPAQRGVPLIVLAGCSTGRDAADEAGAKDLPGLARELAARGIPAVLAMQGPVSDRYATDLAGELFQALATWQDPLPLRALAGARRALETARQQPRPGGAPPPEWPLPALYALNRAPQSLFDPLAGFEICRPRPSPGSTAAWSCAGSGIWSAAAASSGSRSKHFALKTAPGSSSTASAVSARARSPRRSCTAWRKAVPSSPRSPARSRRSGCWARSAHGCMPWPSSRAWMSAIRCGKWRWPYARPSSTGSSASTCSTSTCWGGCLSSSCSTISRTTSTAERRVVEPLGELLARWAERPEHSRLLVTSRYPFELPRGLETAFEAIHLGPLSPAETRKLVLRLPGLAALGPDELQHAYAAVGGHPRTLEYLDALLRGGKARFTDIERRLNTALGKRGITDPKRWYADRQGSLDQALAETVTLAADDVLLDDLLTRLEADPLARDLLLGASVYRVPVDEVGLQWQVSEAMEATDGRPPPAPDGVATARELLEDLSLLAPVRHSDDDPPRWLVHRWTADALAQRFPAERLASAHRRAGRYWRWRVKTQPQSKHQDLLDCLEARFHYHAAGEIDAAFAVASHACLQLETWGAWREAERLIKEMLGWFEEDRTRRRLACTSSAISPTCAASYDQALDWYRQSLAIMSSWATAPAWPRPTTSSAWWRSSAATTTRRSTGTASPWRSRSSWATAPAWPRATTSSAFSPTSAASTTRRSTGTASPWRSSSSWATAPAWPRATTSSAWWRSSAASTTRRSTGTASPWRSRSSWATAPAWPELRPARQGRQDRGEYDQALDWYRQSLAIDEQLGDRAGMATSYHQLGMVAQQRGEYDQALDWYRQALAIFEQLGDRAGMATSYHQLGNVALAARRVRPGARLVPPVPGDFREEPAARPSGPGDGP